MRRVVVTGLGMVTPLGSGVDHNWSEITAGKSGISKIENFDVSDISCRIAGQVPGAGQPGGLNLDDWIDPREQRKQDRFIQLGLAAACQAVEDSGWMPNDRESQNRTGVMIGSGIGGLESIVVTDQLMNEKGPRRISPFFIPSALINLISGHVSIRYGFRGPNHAVVTACSTGAHAIGDAARMVALDDADVMVAGGAEAAVCRIGMAGFAAARALSTSYNDTPEVASRPWDKGRDGFVMGEGAGVVVLEELEHAKKRGAKIYGEIAGYGSTADAYRVTDIHPEGRGATACIRMALDDAGVNTDGIHYINAHGTSTKVNDQVETLACKQALGDDAQSTPVSSIKSMMGHLIAAAGSVEAITCLLAINRNALPPTINYETPDPVCDLDYIPNEPREAQVTTCLSNSFGFGGQNVSLIFREFAV